MDKKEIINFIILLKGMFGCLPSPIASELFMILILLQDSVNILPITSKMLNPHFSFLLSHGSKRVLSLLITSDNP